MKVLCVNNQKLTLEVPRGFPNTPPPNGNMSLLFLKEITYYGAVDMKVGEIYEVKDSKINFYGHLMYWFEGAKFWKPAAAFTLWDPEELEEAGEMNEEVEEEIEFYLKHT